MRNLVTIACVLGLIALVGSGCSKAEKREWNASDHDRPEENAAPQRPTAPPPPTTPAPATPVGDPWVTSCAPCHGQDGKGDGPMGPAMRVADLSRADWQAKVTDAQIADVIKNGRGRMPGFASLPQSSIDSLVQRVRSFK